MAKIEKTDAIVLKSTKFRETSLLITFFTSDFGKIKTIAKGMRKKKSPLLRNFEPFTYQEIVFYHHPRRELNLISDSTLKESFVFIRNSFTKICAASYLVELVEEVMQINQPHKEVFNLLLYALCELKDSPSMKLLRMFEIKILDLIGLHPHLDKCAICGRIPTQSGTAFSMRQGGIVCRSGNCRRSTPDAVNVSAGCIASMKFLKTNTFRDLDRFHLSTSAEGELASIIERFIQYHVHHRLRSIQFIKEVSHAMEEKQD